MSYVINMLSKYDISLSISLSLSFYRNSLGSTTNQPTKQTSVLPPQANIFSLRPESWSCGVVGDTKKPAGCNRALGRKTGGEPFFLESTLKPTWRWCKIAGCNRKWWKVAMKVRSLFFWNQLGRSFSGEGGFHVLRIQKTDTQQKKGNRIGFLGPKFLSWTKSGGIKLWLILGSQALDFLGFCQLNDGRIKKKLDRNWPLLSWALENDSNQNIRVNISFNGEFHEVTTEKTLGFWWLSSGIHQRAWFQWWTSLIHPGIHSGNVWILNTKLNHASTENKGALKQNMLFPFKYSGLLWVYLLISGWLHCVQTFFLFEPWAFWVATFTPTSRCLTAR